MKEKTPINQAVKLELDIPLKINKINTYEKS